MTNFVSAQCYFVKKLPLNNCKVNQLSDDFSNESFAKNCSNNQFSDELYQKNDLKRCPVFLLTSTCLTVSLASVNRIDEDFHQTLVKAINCRINCLTN